MVDIIPENADTKRTKAQGRNQFLHFYITGDTHKKFDRVESFCQEHHTTTDDVMIILGDSGINYWLSPKDEKLKERVARIPITCFCIHGNHEGRPWESPADYKLVPWHGGLVYKEEKYPNILFAKDGEIYDFNGKSVMPIGGAGTINKDYRISHGLQWFASEQPDDTIKAICGAAVGKIWLEDGYYFISYRSD